jgi:hypothetical protein
MHFHFKSNPAFIFFYKKTVLHTMYRKLYDLIRLHPVRILSYYIPLITNK